MVDREGILRDEFYGTSWTSQEVIDAIVRVARGPEAADRGAPAPEAAAAGARHRVEPPAGAPGGSGVRVAAGQRADRY